jgi:hypothetical protein
MVAFSSVSRFEDKTQVLAPEPPLYTRPSAVCENKRPQLSFGSDEDAARIPLDLPRGQFAGHYVHFTRTSLSDFHLTSGSIGHLVE